MNLSSRQVFLLFCALSCLIYFIIFHDSTEAAARHLYHAQYDHSDPPANARLPDGNPPSKVQVWFTEQVDPSYSFLTVYDQSRQRVDLRDSHILADNSYSLLISVRSHLPDGAYTVVFHTVSAEDGHVVTSSFSFVVGGAPLPTNTGALLAQNQKGDTNFNT